MGLICVLFYLEYEVSCSLFHYLLYNNVYKYAVFFFLLQIKSKPSSAQEQFQQQLSDRAKELLKTVNIEERDALAHRICDLEIIELNDEVRINGFSNYWNPFQIIN